MQLTPTRDKYAGHARKPWLVVIPRRVSPTGKRQYRRFATRSQATAFAAAVKGQVRQAGEQPLAAVPARLAADAQAAAALLEGSGLSLVEAVRLALERGSAESVESAPFEPSGGTGAAYAVDGVATSEGAAAPVTLNAMLAIIDAAKSHQSPATIRTRRGACRTLFSRVPGMATTPLHACTPASIQHALDRAWPASAQGWNTGRRILHALFAYAIRKRLVRMENPVTPLDLKHIREAEITALPPDDLRALFAACRPPTREEARAAEAMSASDRQRALADTSSLRAYVAICAFAGIRPAECARLRWGDVNGEEGIISVRGANSKTGGTRHIPIAPALAAWLAACRPDDAREGDLITPPRDLPRRLGALHRRAGYTAESPWPNDCLRHSYATYYLKAKVGDIRQLQYNMGHRSASLLYARYTNMSGVTQAAAEDWWRVLPDAVDGGAGAAV